MIILSNVRLAIVIVILIITGIIGVISGRKVKNSKDFAVSGQSAGVLVLVGMLMAIVGGSATVGTAQMAFEYGLTGWCFCLGGGIACIIMGLFYAKPLRTSKFETLPQFIGNVFGPSSRVITVIVSIVAIFVQVIVQVLTFVALLTVTFRIDSSISILISAGLMVLYILFGGAWGAGIIGIAKSVLLYITLAIAGVAAYKFSGGIQGLKVAFPSYPWFQLFGRGFWKDGSGLISVVIGLLSTQTYIQVMFSGKSVATCRKAAIISGILIPPTGLICVLIGMYMKMSHPGMESVQALPAFLFQYVSPVNGGLAIAALFLAVIGTGSGMVLSMSIMISKDIYGRFLKKDANDKSILFVSRVSVIVILVLSIIFTQKNLGVMILPWSYFSLGVRSSAIFLPLILAFIINKKMPAWIGILGTATGPVTILFCSIFWRNSFDAVYIGLLANSIVLIISFIIYKHTDK